MISILWMFFFLRFHLFSIFLLFFCVRFQEQWWHRWMTEWSTIAYYRVCARLISIFRRWLVFIHMYDARPVHHGWKSNWGENLACCASISVGWKTALGSSHFRIVANCVHGHRVRRMCTLHWCASLLKPIMNFKMYAAISPFTVHGTAEDCFSCSPLSTNLGLIVDGGRLKHLSFIHHRQLKKRTFCFLAQFLLHDNIIASEPH